MAHNPFAEPRSTQGGHRSPANPPNGATIWALLHPLTGATMKPPSGLEILENREGAGPEARAGHTVIYNVRIFLNHGDEVLINEAQATQGMPDEKIRRGGDRIFIDHISALGKRQAIAGIEKALLGMRAGGFRKVRVSPHLAFGNRGVPGLIPPDSVLNISVWLREIVAPNDAVNGTPNTTPNAGGEADKR